MDMICLDTNVLIAHKRAKREDKDKTVLYQLATQGYRFAVSSITVYELLRGDNQDEDRYWKTMFANMEVLPFDYACAKHAASIYQDLKQKGLLIEAEDLFIGATALRHRLKLATSNVRHFERILSLTLV
ncbi:tRNA(fMet)-specific endonuclease VapC [Thiorhodovibrio winogradskyi]|uniref:Ribonuclease VapC n=1 Tax=Thiorhodovibrio winogradskyi TaxID=77007 RepID=A0ABZ0SEI4_9GAMM|nr:type II toxin-antitoxin system VapC family toxin [Thiorhodovibrio winogradskyi]